MKLRLLTAAMCVLATTGCDAGEAKAPVTVRSLGDVPIAELEGRMPKPALLCFGLHYALEAGQVSEEGREAAARDLQATCARSAALLEGGCARYAEKASALGASMADGRPNAERNEAEATAEAALNECVA
jgi:hypothetical protein